MKKIVSEFIRRGLIAVGVGPVVFAVVYLILQQYAAIEVLTVNEICIGIFSLSALAFVAGGMNAIYQIERLPLMAAIALTGPGRFVGTVVSFRAGHTLDCDAVRALRRNDLLVPA